MSWTVENSGCCLEFQSQRCMSTPTITQPSTSQHQKKQKPRRPKRKDTEIPQSSGPTDNVADEAVNEEMDDSLERAATTATSLDAEQDRGGGPRRQETMGDTIAQTRSENVSKHSNDPLLARVLDLENTKTAQAQEITSLKLRVKKLEKKGGSITHKLKRLYKVGRSARMVSSDDSSLGDQEDASKQGRKIDDIDKDVEITLIDETQGRYGDDLMFDTCVLDDEEVFAGQDMDEKEINVAKKKLVLLIQLLLLTLIEIRSAKSKVKGVVIGEQSESTTRTRPQQLPSKDKAELEEEDRLVRQREEKANIVSWDNMQALIDDDYQMAQQMQAEEQEKLSIEEKSKLFVQFLEARKKHFAAIRAKEKRNKPPTKAQKRNTMSTYLKNMAGYKHNQLKNKSFDDIQKLFNKAIKRVNTFVDMDTKLVKGSEVRAEGSETRAEGSSKRAGEELEQESFKKQKLEEDKESEELKQCLEIVPDDGDDVTIDATPLSTKSPTIVDYKIHKEGKKTYYQIIRVDGSSKMYFGNGYCTKGQKTKQNGQKPGTRMERVQEIEAEGTFIFEPGLNS
ncbi:hypothetical protein Tco_1362877 [Tanacetum coccineum]